MEFTIENTHAVIDGVNLSFYIGDDCKWQQKLTDIVFYSTARPFEIENKKWDVVSSTAENGIQKIELSDGTLNVSMLIGSENDAVKIDAVYKNISGKTLKDLTVGFNIDCIDGTSHKPTMPHIIYNDNPSADPDRIVPHIGDSQGKGIIVEENRLPIPAVNIEWKDGNYYALTLLMVPEVVDGYDSEYWSMGILRHQGGEKIAALSGVLMFNGMKDVYYGGRNTPLPYLNGYQILQQNKSLHKTFYLKFSETNEGRGFRDIIRLGYDVLKPEAVRQHSLEQMVAYKKNVMDSRYYEDADCCGYITFGKANAFGNVSGRPEYFLYGWTGQAIKLAWCDCLIGIKEEDQVRISRAMKTVDFYVGNGECKTKPGLILGYYMIDLKEMRPEWKSSDVAVPSRIEGEALIDLIDLMQLLQKNGIAVPEKWEAFVRRAAEFLSDDSCLTKDGIYPVGWNHDGTAQIEILNSAGISCVTALAKAGTYFEDAGYIEKAVQRYERYYEIHMKTFERPFARATMDARCEDKESGIYFFKTAAYLYEITKDDRYKEDAAVAADWLLTFIYFWNTGFQPGTVCNKMKFDSTGWPGVSVQNHHLDVFFPTYELFKFGVLSNQEFYCKMSRCISAALTYGVAVKKGDYDYTVIGEQGEQYYQTNYFQVKYPKIIELTGFYRGGMQVWNPSWITAQVLQSSLCFLYGD